MAYYTVQEYAMISGKSARSIYALIKGNRLKTVAIAGTIHIFERHKIKNVRDRFCQIKLADNFPRDCDMGYCLIYKITRSDGCVYIGSTVKPYTRINQHTKTSYFNGFECLAEVLELCYEELRLAREKFFIEDHKQRGLMVLNQQEIKLLTSIFFNNARANRIRTNSITH